MASQFRFPDVAFRPIDRDALNRSLVDWGHKMGPVRRPTGGWSHALLVDAEPLAVVATDTLIRPRVAGLGRHHAIELSRLCAARPDLCRVVLRLWRTVVFPVLCEECGFVWAVSYQDAALHSGNLYRFDGWVRIGYSRSGTDPRTGRMGRRKIIWGWCDDAEERRRLAESPGGPRLPAETGRTSYGVVPDTVRNRFSLTG
jgi:antitoxin VapB